MRCEMDVGLGLGMEMGWDGVRRCVGFDLICRERRGSEEGK